LHVEHTHVSLLVVDPFGRSLDDGDTRSVKGLDKAGAGAEIMRPADFVRTEARAGTNEGVQGYPDEDTPRRGAMAVDVQSAIVINRPLPEVSRYAANPDYAPLWYVNIKSVEWMTPPPAQVGSRIAFVAHFLGRRLAYTYEIVEFIPEVRLVMRTSEGPFPMETSYAWDSHPNGTTRMTLRNRGTPAGFSVWVAPLMAIAMRRANRKDLALLKERLERVDV
jgi:uncharacterized membrane protein